MKEAFSIMRKDNQSEKLNVLILGASSRIALLMKNILESNQKISITWQSRYLSQDRKKESHQNLALELIDNETKIINSLNDGKQFKSVVCLAGVRNDKEIEHSINYKIAKSALKVADAIGAENLIYFSSSSVYGYGEYHREIDKPNPNTAYGISKLAAEEYLYSSASSVNILSLRIGNIICADSITARYIWDEKPTDLRLDIFPDNYSLTRSYIGPSMLANILIELLFHDQALTGPINIASHQALDLTELLRKMNIPWESVSCDDSRKQRITLSIDRLIELIPQFRTDDTLDSIISEFDHYKSISGRLRAERLAFNGSKSSE